MFESNVFTVDRLLNYQKWLETEGWPHTYYRLLHIPANLPQTLLVLDFADAQNHNTGSCSWVIPPAEVASLKSFLDQIDSVTDTP